MLWRATEIALPPDGVVTPSEHIIKLNNGSGDVYRQAFPVDAAGRSAFATWLERRNRTA